MVRCNDCACESRKLEDGCWLHLVTMEWNLQGSEWMGWMKVLWEMAIWEVVSDWCSRWCDERSRLWPKSF